MVEKGNIFVFRKNDSGGLRLVVIVSARVVKGAVKRNRIKRKIRAIFNSFLLKNKQLRGDFLVIIRNQKRAERPEMEKDVEKVLENLLNKNKE